MAAQFDRAAAKAAGYTDAEIDAHLREQLQGGRVTPQAIGEPIERQVPSDMRKAALDALPAVGGGLGGIVGTGGGTVLGFGVGGLPGGIAGSAIGGAGGEAVRQLGYRALGIPGAPQTPQDALRRIGAEGAVQGAAEGIGSGIVAPAIKAGARGLYRGALRAGMPEAKAAVRTASRLAGERVGPEAASLADQGLAARVPIGAGPGGTGAERIAELRAPHNEAIAQALSDADRAKWSITIKQLADPITELKAELRNEAGGSRAIMQIDRMWRETIGQFTEAPAKGRTLGKSKKISASELNDLKQTWQNQAETIYKSANPSERQALKARFAAALARGARAKIEGIATGGAEIAAANRGLSSLHPLASAVDRAELRMATGSGGGGPWYLHAGLPAVGAAGGALLGHGPGGASAGGLAGLALDRAMNNPALASRAALLMDSAPVIGPYGFARQIPRTANYAIAPGGWMYNDPNQQ